ncbi:MAG: hypothetical protein KJ647_08185 [Candidatus Omnitrophica bacterium]|nr:hypothetical protein [Candidatus Omnitrophota bacterium]
MKKGFLLLLAVSLFLGMTTVNVPASFAQEEEEAVVQDAEKATGEIVSISSERLSMVVKYLVDEELQSYRTGTFYFSDTTEIKKGDDVMKFTDLKVGDTVTLSYSKEGWKKVVASATVKSETESKE